MRNSDSVFMMKMKCFVICFLILCLGHLNLNGQPYNIALEKSNNNCLNQTGSVLRENNSKNHFEKIRVIHKNEGCRCNLQQIEARETREYVMRQQNVIDKMEYNLLKHIPVQKLNKFLEYKFNPIVCNLSIATHEGIVREVSFLINRKISSLFSNEDILSFDKVILNTQFAPDYSMKNGIASFSWVIGRKRIRDFLTYNR